MNKKFLKSLAALFAVAVLGVSCADNKTTEPEKETVTVTEKVVTDSTLGLAFIAGLNGAESKGVEVKSSTFALANSKTLKFSVGESKDTLVVTLEEGTVSDKTATVSTVESSLKAVTKADGTLTKALAEIGITLTPNDSLKVTKDTPDDKSAQSGDITVTLKEGYKLKLDSQGSLKELTDLKKLVVIIKLTKGGSAGWQ